jgi:hypothetical protein
LNDGKGWVSLLRPASAARQYVVRILIVCRLKSGEDWWRKSLSGDNGGSRRYLLSEDGNKDTCVTLGDLEQRLNLLVPRLQPSDQILLVSRVSRKASSDLQSGCAR